MDQKSNQREASDKGKPESDLKRAKVWVLKFKVSSTNN